MDAPAPLNSVRIKAASTHESITNSDTVRVWLRFAHESVTAIRLVRANAPITHGTATLGMARKGKA